MKCPCCGGAELVHDTRSVTVTYRGKMVTVPAVEGDYCPACDEVILDQVNGDRYSALLDDYANLETGLKRTAG